MAWVSVLMVGSWRMHPLDKILFTQTGPASTRSRNGFRRPLGRKTCTKLASCSGEYKNCELLTIFISMNDPSLLNAPTRPLYFCKVHILGFYYLHPSQQSTSLRCCVLIHFPNRITTNRK